MNLEKYHSKKNGLKKGLTGMFTLRNTSFSPIHPDKHLLQEKIPLRDKLNAARSTDYADNIQQEVLTLPEVRGLSDGLLLLYFLVNLCNHVCLFVCRKATLCKFIASCINKYFVGIFHVCLQ